MQSIREFYTLYDIKHKYPKNVLTNVLTEHQKKFINFITFVEYYSVNFYFYMIIHIMRNIIPLALQLKYCYVIHLVTNIRDKIKEIENTGYKFIKHQKNYYNWHIIVLEILILYIILKMYHKQIVENTILKLIDTQPWIISTYRSKNYYNPLSNYIDMKLYDYKDFPLDGLREIKYYNILNG